jgi:ferredoxin
MHKRVYLDEDECIGCGTCEELCPDVFRLNEDTQKAEIIQAQGGPENQIDEAIESCPVSCIHWKE